MSQPAMSSSNAKSGVVVATPWEKAAPNLLTAARVVLAIAFFAVLAPFKYHKSVLVNGVGPDPYLLVARGCSSSRRSRMCSTATWPVAGTP